MRMRRSVLSFVGGCTVAAPIVAGVVLLGLAVIGYHLDRANQAVDEAPDTST